MSGVICLIVSLILIRESAWNRLHAKPLRVWALAYAVAGGLIGLGVGCLIVELVFWLLRRRLYSDDT